MSGRHRPYRRRVTSRVLPGPTSREATNALGFHLLLAVVLMAALFAASGCSVEEDEPDRAPEPATETESASLTEPSRAATPITGFDEIEPERIEAERHDPSWREYATRNRELRRSPAPAPARGEADGRSATRRAASRSGNPVLGRLQSGGNTASSSGSGESGSGDGESSNGGTAETWESIAPDAFDGEPSFPIDTDGGGPTVLRLQRLLDRAGFSPGVIDGRWGKNTEKAVYWLQDSLGMEPTGTPDRALYDRLVSAVGESSPVREYTVTEADVSGPFVDIPEETEPKAELDCLCYESAEELLAERFHTTPELLGQLNPDADLANVSAGDTLWVPAIEVVEPGEAGEGGSEAPIDKIVISKKGFYLHALDDSGKVIYHFPSTLGTEYDPSPDGTWKVTGVAWKPDFHYQPKLFSDVPDSEEDLMLPPGPNSPVGIVWMSLSKDNYGIHGTAAPATIGYTSSHGCIRLTNWDAIFLGHRVKPGTPVEFTE